MKKLLGIVVLGLLWCNVALTDGYVNRVKWGENSDKTYRYCAIFSFVCTTYKSVSIFASKSKAEIGSYLKIYNLNGKMGSMADTDTQVDNFEVKTIYFEKKTKKCRISKISKEEPHTYLIVHDCVVY